MAGIDDYFMGSIAAQDQYNPGEGAFQRGIRDTPWFSEFTQHYGGEPNLNDPNYDYRAAWAAGARPDVRDPEDKLLHWPSQFKGPNHPNRFVHGVDTITGEPVLPDVGPPLIPSGGQFSPGLPAVNQFADQWGQPAAPPDPTVLYNTKAGPITMGDLARASDLAMGFSGGGLTTKPIKAYHSSPHDFEKFDLSKIGTGEGAQVYGHGLYFAENPAVSGQGGEYWQRFLRRFPEEEYRAANRLRETGFDRDAAIAATNHDISALQSQIAGMPEKRGQGYYRERDFAWKDDLYEAQLKLAERQKQQELLTSGQPVGPRTYEVGIHADPQTFLNWDQPLNKQSQQVQEILRARNGPFLGAGDLGGNWSMPGSQYYKYRTSPGMKNPAELSRQLSEEYGIPGIRYLDAGSRPNPNPVWNALDAPGPKPKPTHNYVVFDPSIVQIMKKYGIVGAPMGALAAQDYYDAR